jgi:predicted GNAT family acetyltransferase
MSVTQDHCVNEPENNRYIVNFHDGGQGELIYQREGDVLKLLHAEVPNNRRGDGLGARLMQSALTQIQADKLTVIPVCRYTKHYLKRNKQWAALLA